MTDKPNIAALRIDERLVHGQGQLWIKTLGVNTVIVANDEAANDPIQQTLMKTVIPKTIAMRFFTVQHTCDVIYKASPKQVMFIICKSAEDALKLVEGGVPVTYFAGNKFISHSATKNTADAISCTAHMHNPIFLLI